MKVAILVLCTLSVAIASPLSWRIVGGHDAQPGQYPHQISLRQYGSHSCGGSILDETTILTAAHCVSNVQPSSTTVVVGSLNLSSGGRSHKVKWFRAHEDYNPYDIVNDVALVKLAEPIQFDENVKPIDLPTENIEGGKPVELSGWGRLSYPGSLPDRLQCIQLETITVAECQAAHTNKVVDSEVCTFTKRGEGACHGDSGGPLINSNSKQLAGIVSWGRPCAVGYPDVFTRVYSHLEWIRRNRH